MKNNITEKIAIIMKIQPSQLELPSCVDWLVPLPTRYFVVVHGADAVQSCVPVKVSE